MTEEHLPQTADIGALWSLEPWTGVVATAELLAHVRPAYGGDRWNGAIQYLLDTPSEREVVDLLIGARDAHGLFAEPVVIDRDERAVVIGMHRLAAAAFTFSGWMRVSNGYPSREQTASVEYAEVDYRLTASGAWPVDDTNDLPELTYAVNWLRSFPLPDGTWVTSDCFSGSHGSLNSVWVCPRDRFGLLVATLRERAARHGVAVEILTSRHLTGAEWDAEIDEVLGPTSEHRPA